MKVQRNYRISVETDALIKVESVRLSNVEGSKVSEADVIERALVFFLSGDRPAPKKESKAARLKRELAESDVTGMAVGREDIDYGSDEVPSRHVIQPSPPPYTPSTYRKMKEWRASRQPILKPKDR